MYRSPFDPSNPIYQYIVQNPYDNIARSIFGDWLQEHGYDDIGAYVVGDVHGNLTNEQRMTKELMWRTWMCNISTDQQIIVEWADGLPSIINLRANRRQFLIFEWQWGADFTISEFPLTELHGVWRLNLPHVRIYFHDLIQQFPIREIHLGVCTVYPYHGIMVWDTGEEYQVHTYRRAGHTLHGWWRSLQHEFIMPYGRHPERTRENLLRGYGDMWLAQCARATTVGRRRRSSANSRSMVESFPRDISIDAGHDGLKIHRLQQCLRSFPVEQAVQHVATL